MSFVKTKVDMTPIEDTVFAIVKKAKEAKAKIGAENVVDATIGITRKEVSLLLKVYLHHMIKLRKKQRQRMQEAL